MAVDVDTFTNVMKGTQQLEYTNNSSDTLRKVFYHLYWNAFQFSYLFWNLILIKLSFLFNITIDLVDAIGEKKDIPIVLKSKLSYK